MPGAGEEAGAVDAESKHEASGEAAAQVWPTSGPLSRAKISAGSLVASAKVRRAPMISETVMAASRPLPLSIADDRPRPAIRERNDLEEIAAYYLGGEIKAGDLMTGDQGQ